MTNPDVRVRRRIAAAVLAALAVPTVPMRAAAGPRRIGLLALYRYPDVEPYTRWDAAFREGLRQRGHVEGTELVIETRFAAGAAQRLPALAAELLASRPDVLVTAPAGTAAYAAKATRTVPIVFIGEPDPVGTRLVASLARPGANVTGLADAHADLVPKRLELLMQVAPPGAPVAMLWNPANPGTSSQVRIAQAAAASLGRALVAVGIKGPRAEDVDEAFDAIVRQRAGSVLVVGDSTLGTHRSRIAALAIRHRLPTSGSHGAWAEGGLLMSYGTEFTALFRRAASIVDKVLNGANPADLPVEQPTVFELVLNARTAKTMGLALPPSLVSRSDRVIE